IPSAEEDQRFSRRYCGGNGESEARRFGCAAGRASLNRPTAKSDRFARASIYQFDELVLSAVAYAIVISITRDSVRWIGEYFVDENCATRIAEEVDHRGITFA